MFRYCTDLLISYTSVAITLEDVNLYKGNPRNDLVNRLGSSSILAFIAARSLVLSPIGIFVSLVISCGVKKGE